MLDTGKKTRVLKRNCSQFILQSIAWILILVMSAGCLTGCSGGKTQKVAENSHEIVDCAGRTVYVPDKVESISCLYAYAGHACVFLGCEDRITSVVNGLKRDALMLRKVENLKNMPAPYQSQSINVEELTVSDPDVVLLRTANLSSEGEIEKLDRTGIPYVVIDYVTMEEQKNSIAVIGEALGCEEKAEAYLTYYDETLAMVKDRVSQIPEEERKTVYHSVNEVVRTDEPDTLSYEVMEAAGLINVIDSTEDVSLEGVKTYATLEQIYLWDPDLVLVNEPEATAYFLEDSKLEGLRAVKERQVYQLPIGLSRWGHPGSIESPLAVLFIAKLAYPEYFEDIDMDQEVKDFYSKFIEIDLSDDELQQIYTGEGMRAEKDKG